ncbi:MAG: histidine phosphatase family protein, partial [Oxalobacteraceae bacterium]
MPGPAPGALAQSAQAESRLAGAQPDPQRTLMELILWRHAEAEDGADDMARVLTPKGRRQAARMAQWLTAQLDGPVQVIASPALRTRATADALDMPYAIDWRIAPDASADQLLAASGWPDGHGIVILVGH